MTSTTHQQWKNYCEEEFAYAQSLVNKFGFTLDEKQPHIQGERFLMQAVTTTSGKKLILLGRIDATGEKVVIKVTRDKNGQKEIEHERVCREVLHKIRFAYDVFLSPEEILHIKEGDALVSVQKFIEQDRTFLEHSIEEQFSLTLRAFKAQESAHATTYGHQRIIKKTFGCADAAYYQSLFTSFKNDVQKILQNPAVDALLEKGTDFLKQNTEIIEQYTGFLTHTDFVPHNIRIKDNDIYLLDYSSLRFGNKYEGWARFLNFMTLYNPTLEEYLLTYLQENRTAEEAVSLKAMRIFRLGEIIWYYTNTLSKTSGDLQTLNKARIDFWSAVLKAILADTKLPQAVRDVYINTRDSLRSPEEKQRQVGLH